MYRMKTILIAAGASVVATIPSMMFAAEVPYTSEGMKWELAPKGHVPGKDNGKETLRSAGNEFHYTGEDCGICHAPNGKAKDFVFSMAGTMYKDRAGRETLEGAEIILKDASGKVISMTSNKAGNFYTYEPIASDPQAWRAAKVGEDLTDPATKAAYEKENQADSATWRYKAWVIKNGLDVERLVLPMVSVVAVGSRGSNLPRMGCAMHHAPSASRGALLATGYPTLSKYPETGVSFKRHVMPILKNRCKSCHLPNAANPFATEPNGTKYDHSGGVDLTSYNKDPKSATGVMDMVNTINPDASKLLSVSMQGAKHAGGASWRDTSDPDYKIIRQWIVEGALNN